MSETENLAVTIVDVPAARELLARAYAQLGGPASLDGALTDAEDAVEAAAILGDEALALDALECRAQVLTGMGEATAADWLAVEHAATAARAWPRAAGALRMQAMRLLDDHAPDADAPAQRLAIMAARHDMPDQHAWADSVRAEISFLTGDWDEATTMAMRAVGSGGRTGDAAATMRGWHVVIPIAFARGDVTRLGLAYYPYSLRSRVDGDTHYRRVLDVAAMLRFSQAGLCDPPDAAPDDLLPSIEGSAVMPHWLAALETVVDEWIDAGQFGAAEQAVESMSRSHASGNASKLGAGVEALLRARLLAAEGSPSGGVTAHGWRALEMFASAGAPWWTAKAIRLLAKMKEAPAPLRSEAKRIEAALGVQPIIRG